MQLQVAVAKTPMERKNEDVENVDCVYGGDTVWRGTVLCQRRAYS